MRNFKLAHSIGAILYVAAEIDCGRRHINEIADQGLAMVAADYRISRLTAAANQSPLPHRGVISLYKESYV